MHNTIKILLFPLGVLLTIVAFRFRMNSVTFSLLATSGTILMGYFTLYILTKWATNIGKMMVWLIVAPLVFALFLFECIGFVNTNLSRSDLVISSLLFASFIITWILGAFVFEYKKIKVAVLLLDAFFATVLSLAVFVYFANYQQLSSFFTQSVLQEIKQQGLSLSEVLELFIKITTLPYVLASFWAIVFIEIKELGVIPRKYEVRQRLKKYIGIAD